MIAHENELVLFIVNFKTAFVSISAPVIFMPKLILRLLVYLGQLIMVISFLVNEAILLSMS
jgi:hypothetical protein